MCVNRFVWKMDLLNWWLCNHSWVGKKAPWRAVEYDTDNNGCVFPLVLHIAHFHIENKKCHKLKRKNIFMETNTNSFQAETGVSLLLSVVNNACAACAAFPCKHALMITAANGTVWKQYFKGLANVLFPLSNIISSHHSALFCAVELFLPLFQLSAPFLHPHQFLPHFLLCSGPSIHIASTLTPLLFLSATPRFTSSGGWILL